MKKVFLSVFVVGTLLTAAHAQTRNCGTMEYNELRKQQDPSLEKRMDDDEKLIQKWIKENPAKEVTAKATLPAVPGFIATGNEELDKFNYAKAKAKYHAQHGTTNGNAIQAETSIDKILREKKRKENTFITIN